jgi:Ca2+-binding RTX toxin-like protein
MMGRAIADQGLRRVRSAPAVVLLSALAVLTTFAGTASGATVSKSGTTITYQANVGETNQTVLTRSGNNYVFTETGSLTAGTNCTQTSTSVVTCTQANPTIVANLLDRDDTFSASGVTQPSSVTLNGGDGADTITAPNVGTTLNGDNGNDTLNGGNGADTLNGGNGDAGMDRMTGNAGDDTFDGGPGIDRAIYTTGNLEITIDNVANDKDGVGSQSDNVMDTVESITGASGNDKLVGSCFANTLAGQDGNDDLIGDPTTCATYGGDFMGGGDGNDQMKGSLTPTAYDGVDRVTYTSNTVGQDTNITLDGKNNDGDGLGNTKDNVDVDIEYVYGGPEADTFNACGAPFVGNCFNGAALQGVSFWSGGGADTLIGSDFDDYFDGQAGADSQDCKGGANDTYKVDGADPAPVNCETPVP